MMRLGEFVRELVRRRRQQVVVTTMGSVRPWARFSDSSFDFASADSAMGHAADLALGIALAQPERGVLCLNGDGSMLMTLGTLATVAAARANLALFIIENGTYEITGNQPIPAAGRIDFEAAARAAGIVRTCRIASVGDCTRLDDLLCHREPRLAVVEVEPGTEGPLSRGSHNPEVYLQPSLAESALALRRALTGDV